MDVSAVVLSASSVTLEIPGVTVVPHVSRFNEAAGLLDARLEAISKVKTEWFFCLDDDDELPENYLDVLARCIAAPTPLAYTNELIRRPDGTEAVWRQQPYSHEVLIHNSALMHHLVVCRTSAAHEASAIIPRGVYAFEPLLWGQVARMYGATWLDEVGYIWNKGNGLNRNPSLIEGFVHAVRWLQGVR